MLNLHQIERLLDDGQYRQLVDRILANGRAIDPSLRSALTQQAVLVPVALGLALQRACELSYGPNELTERIVVRLLDLQLPDGRFGSERRNPRETIIASAIALRGLLDHQQQQAFFSPLSLRAPRRAGVRPPCPLSLRERAGVRVPCPLSPRERAGVKVLPESNHVDPPTRPPQSSPLTTHPSSQSLATAVERTVGALAAAVAGEVTALHAVRSNADEHRDDLLPLQIAAWQLATHHAAVAHLSLPRILKSIASVCDSERKTQSAPMRRAVAA